MIRKAILYLLASGPLLLLGMISINSRLNRGQWDFVEYSPEATVRITAYVKPIIASRGHFQSGEHRDCAQRCPGVDAWLSASRSGELKDIHPPTAAYADSSHLYDQILREKTVVVGHALKLAKRLEAAGHHYAAASSFADVLELSDAAKFSEFGAFVDASTVQLAALERIASIADLLTDQERLGLVARIDSLASPDRSLAHTVDKLSTVYRLDQARMNKSTTTFEAARDGRRLASSTDPMKDKIEFWQTLIGSDASALTLYAQSQLAYIQNVKFGTALAQTKAALVSLTVSSN